MAVHTLESADLVQINRLVNTSGILRKIGSLRPNTCHIASTQPSYEESSLAAHHLGTDTESRRGTNSISNAIDNRPARVQR